MAGYSKTPLAKKLGIKANSAVMLLNEPPDFRRLLDPLPDGVTFRPDSAGADSYDIILFFTEDRAQLATRFGKLSKRLKSDGGFWVCWPKKASGVVTDLTEDVIRNIALAAGLVDNKVCAVDETWSGLRLVIRLIDRPKKVRR